MSVLVSWEATSQRTTMTGRNAYPTMEAISIERRASRIKLLLMDCDGVLTDGRVWLFADGEQQKGFHVRDGLALELLHSCGIQSGVISGLTSAALERRSQALKITYVRQGNPEKISAFEEVLALAKVDEREVAYVGDDLTDIPLMQRVGFAIAVGDAVPETKGLAHYITELPGGFGAVREVVEIILKAQGHWSDVLDRYRR